MTRRGLPDRLSSLLTLELAPQTVFPTSRVDLIERARSSGSRVVGVTAPAGYGKSTLLAEWARAEDRGTAWVSLDRFDDDPAVLLGLLAAAYGRFDPDRAAFVAETVASGVSLLGRTAPRVASAFASSPVPFVLFLDDLHELRSPDCHDVLGVVVARIPAGSQLVVASRSEQPHLPACGLRGMRSSSRPATWPSTLPAHNRSSPSFRSPCPLSWRPR